MQKPFTTQSELFVSASDIDHPIGTMASDISFKSAWMVTHTIF